MTRTPDHAAAAPDLAAQLRTVLQHSTRIRLELHPTGPACFALTDGRILPRDPSCEGRCEQLVHAALAELRLRHGRSGTLGDLERDAATAVFAQLYPDQPTNYEVSEAEQHAAALNATVSLRQRFHQHGTPCRGLATADGGLKLLTGRDEDPSCDGRCLELVTIAVGTLRHRLGDGVPPARIARLATNAVTDAIRFVDGTEGLYQRLDRLNPDHPGNFEVPTTDPDATSPSAPAWYRKAIAGYAARRRAYALLYFARSQDLPPRDGIWPLARWADEDGLSVAEEEQLVTDILLALESAAPGFFVDNVVSPMARKVVPVDNSSRETVDLRDLIRGTDGRPTSEVEDEAIDAADMAKAFDAEDDAEPIDTEDRVEGR